MTEHLGKMNFLKNIRINSVEGTIIAIDKIKEKCKYIKQDINQKNKEEKFQQKAAIIKTKKKETKITISKKMTKKKIAKSNSRKKKALDVVEKRERRT